MRKSLSLIFILASLLLIGGCATTGSSIKVSEDNQYPTITASLSPSNPYLGRPFTLNISAKDDGGLKRLYWESSKPFSNDEQKGFFECNSQKICSKNWEFQTVEEGLHELTIYTVDSSNQESGRIQLEVNVGTFRKTSNTTTQTTVTPVSEPNKTTTPNETTTEEIAETNSCSSNSDCGYKQVCNSGKCESVECTNDAHCTGCRRCLSNSCVSCGRGPYGCYC